MVEKKWIAVRNLTKDEADVAKWLESSMSASFNDPDFLRDNPDAPQPSIGEPGRTLDNLVVRVYTPQKGEPSLKGHSGRILNVLRHPFVVSEVEDRLTSLYAYVIEGFGQWGDDGKPTTRQIRTVQINIALRLWEKIQDVWGNPWKYA